MANKSNGQVLIEKLAAFFGKYLYLSDPTTAVVLALWVVGSWVFDRFYSWPYLAVCASIRGAGKSRVLELANFFVRNGLLSASPTPAFVLREAKIQGGHFTLLWDEAEAASSDVKSFLSEVLNSGYRRGQWIGRAKGPDETVKYPSYFPKAFALIGDVTGTVRDRSIIVNMERGNAPSDFVPEVAEGEAAPLAKLIQAVLGMGDSSVSSAPPDWLDTRDREIWGAMFGLAAWLKLDRPMVEKLERWAADNVAGKLAPKRVNTSYEDEDAAIDSKYSERALRDLASIFQEGEKQVTTADALQRMRDIPTGPWRAFKGVGLSDMALSGLVSRFGVHPKQCWFKTKPNNRNGYKRADVFASVVKG